MEFSDSFLTQSFVFSGSFWICLHPQWGREACLQRVQFRKLMVQMWVVYWTLTNIQQNTFERSFTLFTLQGIVSRGFVFASDEKILKKVNTWMNMSALLLFAALPFSAIAMGVTQVLVSRGEFKSNISVSLCL